MSSGDGEVTVRMNPSVSIGHVVHSLARDPGELVIQESAASSPQGGFHRRGSPDRGAATVRTIKGRAVDGGRIVTIDRSAGQSRSTA
jgi:hypothetical protein